MIIGNFTYDPAQDTYTGELATLTVAARTLVLKPNEGSKGDKAKREPNYRITSPVKGGDVEVGGAWKKYTNDGDEYLSVTLTDPALPQAINCAMFGPGESGGDFILVWSRPQRKAQAA